MSMLCYQCGSPLGSGRYCLRCGADVSMYRKIARLSNRYYNRGLERARLRDLSGAVDALSRSLQIDKRNIQARNLLGLVLYEMGETVDALCEWVISTNYQPEDNLASEYVQHLQDQRLELDAANQGIRKFNVALDHAYHGNEDLALLQLQYVLQQHPTMLKAHELKALLHVSEGDRVKAEREARYVLKVDRENPFCKHLLAELGNAPHPSDSAKTLSFLNRQVKKKTEQITEEGKRVGGALKGRPGFLIRFVLGMVILVCAFMGIIMPTLSRQKQSAVSDAVALYAERLETVRQELAVSQEKSDAYEILLEMSRLDFIEDREQIEGLFSRLKAGSAETELYRQLYDEWLTLLAPSETIAVRSTAAEENSEEETAEAPESESAQD